MASWRKVPDVIAQALRAFDGRQRMIAFLCGGCAALVALVAGILLTSLVDWLVSPSLPIRMALSLVTYLVAFGLLSVYALWPLVRSRPPYEVASRFESAAWADGHKERLSSAVEFAVAREGVTGQGVGQWMINRTIALAANEVSNVDPIGLVDGRPAKRSGRIALFSIALLALVSLFPEGRSYLHRAIVPSSDVVRPATTVLDVRPGDIELAQGAELEILATTDPPASSATATIVWKDGLVEEMPLSSLSAEGEFRLPINGVTREFRYSVHAGDATSPEYDVSMKMPPRLSGIGLEVTPPSYAGWPVRRVEGGDAEVLLGSDVKVMLRFADAPANSASLLLDNGAEQPFDIMGDEAETSWQPRATQTYGLRFTADDGLEVTPAQRWRIHVVEDLPPTATLSGESLAHGLVGDDELLLLTAETRDDVGVASCKLFLSVDGREIESMDLPMKEAESLQEVDSGEQVSRLATALDLSRYALEYGDTLSLGVEVRDLGGHVVRSEAVELTVVAPEDTKAVQLAARLRKLRDQLTRQVRKQRENVSRWQRLIREGDPEDEADRHARLILLQARWDELAEEVDTVGGAVADESAEATEPLDAVLEDVGGRLVSLATSLHEITEESIAGVEAASPDELEESLQRGLDLQQSALADLEEWDETLGMVVAEVEADALVARDDAAQRRYRRSFPIVRGASGWAMGQPAKGRDDESPEGGAKASAFAGGLSAEYFRGEALGDRPARTEVSLPDYHDLDVPGIGKNNFSIRYRGDVFVPNKGRWRFACKVDDGARLVVAEKPLIGSEGWKHQAPTEYSGTLELSAGWHPIVLEAFQGTGESHLEFSMAPEGQPLKKVPAERLREHQSFRYTPLLLKQMAELSLENVESAQRRLHKDLRRVAPTAAIIEQLARDSGIKGIDKIADRERPHSLALEEVLEREPWSIEDLRGGEHSADLLVDAARAARDLIKKGMHSRYKRMQLSGKPTTELAKTAEQLREHLRSMREIPRKLTESERDRHVRREQNAAKAWVDQLERVLEREEAASDERSRDADASLAERVAHVETASALARKTEEVLDEVRQRLERDGVKHREVSSQAEQALSKLNDTVRKQEQAQQMTRERELADASREAMEQVRDLVRARHDQNAPKALEAHEELTESLAEVAELTEAAGDRRAASDLRKMAEETLEDSQVAKLASRLRKNIDRSTARRPESLAKTLTEQLAHDKSEVEKNIPDRESQRKAKAGLARSVLASALEAERERGNKEEAAAYRQLGQDILEELLKEEPLKAERIEPLAQRAAALEGAKGDQAKKEEIAAALERQEGMNADTPATKENAEGSLEELAQRAEEARRDKEKREDFLETLKGMLASHQPPPSGDAARAMAERSPLMNQSLEDLLAREEQLEESEKQARSALAETSTKAAKSLDALKKKAAAMKGQEQPKAAKQGLEQMTKKAPQAAKELGELAKKAASPPPSEKNPAAPGTPSDELVREANKQADMLRDELAGPIAEAFSESAAEEKMSDQQRQQQAELGQALARMASDQRQATDELERVLKAQAEHRREWARQLEKAVAPMELSREEKRAVGEAMKVAKQARQLQEQANRTQQEADRQQADAEERMRAADALASDSADRGKLERAKQQGKQAAERAMETQRHAVAQQKTALDAQLRAMQAQESLPSNAAFPLMADTASDLHEALDNSDHAEANSESSGEAMTASPKAEANKQGAQANKRTARAALMKATERLAKATEESLRASEAANAEAMAQAQQAAETSEGKPSGPLSQQEAKGVAEALAGIEASNQSSDSFQNAAKALAQAAQQERVNQAANNLPSVPSLGNAGSGTGQSSDLLEKIATMEGSLDPDWARLAARKRASIRNTGGANFPREYREAIDEYFLKLGEGE
ncbi:PA14 domain protein [Planctomycetes bacterium Pan216]|uniref:PA14 domain protein n=1 Tax=Kolteria novifilia TaxID=2527975 RepID=A0A518AZH2_9BACT|nr:PA14 domain protein [Planctomycetes bacterium Pan216]